MTDKRQSIKKLWDAYAIKEDAPLVLDEFSFYAFDRWIKEGHIEAGHSTWEYDNYVRNKFFLDHQNKVTLYGLGHCEAEFFPMFEEKLLEDRGDHELVRDMFGRDVLYFKNRRSGFMPEYVNHPVKDMQTWIDNCKWRMNPKSEQRYIKLESDMKTAMAAQKDGMMITQKIVGGYMYLRSLIGPLELLYAFYDIPDVIHNCMQTWYELSDYVISKHQEYVRIDEIFFSEDISYNKGNLISPQLIHEFLFPYYEKIIANVKERNKKYEANVNNDFYLQLDSDGYCIDAINLYKKIGFNVFSPFEVAAGCDVIEIGKQFPEIIMSGGIDKRVLAGDKAKLEIYLDKLLLVMRKRGGYIPTCDHGVPEEVPFENYMLFRKKCLEYTV